MCGIAGYFCTNDSLSRTDLERMGSALKHRGPDAEGFFIEGRAGFVHRRLSIIDLSVAANQPMVSHCGRYVMIYNGEVYNYREIGEEIAKKTGRGFNTHSDTEVVLEAFVLWGADCVRRFNGMFAIAVYDRQGGNLTLMRDRIGIKPLFVYHQNNVLVFASELKAILSIPAIREQLQMNEMALLDFLHLGYIPEPYTAWTKIMKFPSGCHATYDGKDLHIQTYWDPADRLEERTSADPRESLDRLKDLLVSSVKMRLVSDVPFGTFLSGGIDSSLVTAIAQSVHTEAVNTFSIGFEESTHDESAYARAVAQHLGTRHHEFTVRDRDAMELLPLLPGVFDEPFADASAIPTMLVSSLARSRVTMTLSGDGGDELFMGYGSYRWAQRLAHPLWHMMRLPAGKLLRSGSGRHQRISDLLLHENRNIAGHIFSQEHYWFSAQEIRSLMTGKNDYQGIAFVPPAHARTLKPAEQQAYFDLTHYLKDDLLVKVDRATMQHSLESRVPLLDYRIVEFALNLDQRLKYHQGTSKYLLKQLLYTYLPEKLFDRPKWGFAIPLDQWLKGPLKAWMTDALSETMIKKHGLIKPQQVNRLVKRYLQTDASYLYNRIWALIMLHAFLEMNKPE